MVGAPCLSNGREGEVEEIAILVGTETGNAEDVADELAAALEEVGVGTEVMDMEDADSSAFDGGRAVIICTATHGDGELPENSIEFYELLEEERPDMSGVRFAVCVLGDSVYPDFCEAGRIWGRFLSGLGATEVIERYEIDGFPEDEDIDRAIEWVERAADRFLAPAGDRT